MDGINFGQKFFQQLQMPLNKLIVSDGKGGGAPLGEGFVAPRQNSPVERTFGILSYATEATVLKNESLSGVLKNLMNMQKDLGQFLAQHAIKTDVETLKNFLKAYENLPKSEIAKFLLEMNADTKVLAEFISKNSSTAVENLFKMSTELFQSSGIKISKLSDIASVIRAFSVDAEASGAQVLKNIMLLYLPWLPLGVQNAFSLEFGTKDGKDGECEDDYISVKMATVNFGNISVLIYKTSGLGVEFKVTAPKTFPVESFKKMVGVDLKEYNVPSETKFVETKQGVYEKSEKTLTKADVSVGTKFNPFLFLVAQSVIRTIVILDKRGILNEKKGKADENQN